MAGQNKLAGSLAFNGIFLVIVCLNLSVLAGLVYYPQKLGIYFVLPYYTYTKVFSRAELEPHGSRWSSFSKNFAIFRIMREYLQLGFLRPLPEKLVDSEKAPDAQFLFAFFPHGIACDYRILMDGMLHEVFPNVGDKIKALSASILFKIPLVREMALWTGCVDASRPVAESVIEKGYSILVLPGGEAEQIRTIYRKERIYLKNRKGFIKLAMRKGVKVVPAYVFGVNDYYYTSDAFAAPRTWIQKRLGICFPLAIGLWGSMFCPLPVKTTIVFGEPLSFKIDSTGFPTDAELNAAHGEFSAALKNLFDAHKHELGYGDRVLEIL